MIDTKSILEDTRKKKKIGTRNIVISIAIVFLISAAVAWWLVTTYSKNNNGGQSKSSVTSLIVNDGASDKLTIWEIPMETPVKSLGKSVISDVRELKGALEINCENKKIYYFGGTKKGWSIEEMSYNGSNKNIIINGINEPFGMSIDWTTQELYWTDTGRKTINVANLTSFERKELVKTSPFEPRGIAFHPRLRTLYWLIYDPKNHSSRLEMSDENGLNRIPFLNDVIENRAHHLSIDWNSNDLCWTTDSDICCANIETREVRTIYTVRNPILLRVSNDAYYWTELESRSVYYLDKNLSTFGQITNFGHASNGDIHGLALVENKCPFDE